MHLLIYCKSMFNNVQFGRWMYLSKNNSCLYVQFSAANKVLKSEYIIFKYTLLYGKM